MWRIMINLLLAILIPIECLAGKFDGLDISKVRSFSFEAKKFILNIEERRQSKLILFGADWCGPCQKIKADKVWAEQSGWKFGKYGHIEIIDVDLDPELFAKYNKGDNTVPKVVNIETGETLTPGSMLDVLNFYRKKRE